MSLLVYPLVLGLRVLHRFWLELLDASILFHEYPPRKEQGRCCEPDGGGVGELRRIRVTELKHGDEALDGKRHYDHNQEPGQEASNPRRSADVSFAQDLFLDNRLTELERSDSDRQQPDHFQHDTEPIHNGHRVGRKNHAKELERRHHRNAESAGKEQSGDETIPHKPEFVYVFHELLCGMRMRDLASGS